MRIKTVTKISNSSDLTNDNFADALKALGHPSRLEIIRQLSLRDRCCGGDFCDCLDLAQSTISQHLDQLKTAGLIERTEQGTKSIYTLNHKKIAELSERLLDILQGDSLDRKNGTPAKPQ